MASVIVLATPAQADILLEFDRLISGVEGSVRTIGEVEVASDLVGQTCQVSVIGENQASVHPGNDLIVSTGGSSAVVVGVEDEVDAGINHTSQLVLGSTIVVQLRFGPDELSSLGFSLSFDCTQPATTTTSTTIATTSSSIAVGSNCGDGAAVTGDTTDGLTEAGADGSDCAPVSCTDDSAVATNVATASSGSAAVGTDGSDCAPTSCTDDGSAVATTVTTASSGSAAVGTDGSDCAPANCTDDGASTATTASTGGNPVAEATGCPEPTSNQVSTTTAPPVTTAPTAPTSTTTTVASSGSATVALPQSPVATAIAAAPAYAG